MTQRIVLLSAFLSPFRSGAEAAVEEVALRLKNRYDITIVTARLRRTLPPDDHISPLSRQASGQEGEGSGVRVVRVGIGHPIDKYLFPFLAPFAARRCKPQIIHAVLESYAGLALVCCRWLVPRARRILTCQSTNTTLLLGLMHRSAHTITVISRVLQRRAMQFGTQATLIPNGIDRIAIERACLGHPKVPGRILFVGRLETMKGVDVLLRAFRMLVRDEVTMTKDMSHELRVVSDEDARCKTQDARLSLRIVGDGSQWEMLEKLAVDLGIRDRVTFVGWVKVPNVYDEYAQAEIFCGLSRSEALGNVFLEAQAAGCAVIGTTVGGIPDSVESGVTGLLIPPDDADAAAEAMRRLLEDPAKRRRLAEAGKAHAAGYDWDQIAERYGMMYGACV